ncbi:MAG: hypothetical protein HUU26_03090 [Gemmatimonadaceae bacterium]|nr:hypothetical protein [Gemmatimonadaceae bacterium]
MRTRYSSFALLLPLAAACGVLEASGGPRVTLSVSSQPLDPVVGDTARLAITVRNVGDRMVTIGSAGCNMDFFLSDPDGNAYTPAEAVYCTLELRAPIELSPGRSHRIDAFTTGRVVPQGSQDGPRMLPPGLYRIRPVVSVFSGDESAVVVSSDPVLVRFR